MPDDLALLALASTDRLLDNPRYSVDAGNTFTADASADGHMIRVSGECPRCSKTLIRQVESTVDPWYPGCVAAVAFIPLKIVCGDEPTSLIGGLGCGCELSFRLAVSVSP